MTKCKAAMVTGQPIPKANGKHRFAFYCDEWLNASKGKLKESTAVKYSSMLEKHIKPKLSQLPSIHFRSPQKPHRIEDS